MESGSVMFWFTVFGAEIMPKKYQTFGCSRGKWETATFLLDARSHFESTIRFNSRLLEDDA